MIPSAFTGFSVEALARHEQVLSTPMATSHV